MPSTLRPFGFAPRSPPPQLVPQVEPLGYHRSPDVGVAMAEAQHGGILGAVYEAKRPDEIAALYDSWADTYDAEMAAAGYRHPSICLALLARHLPRGSAPLLDAGAA